MGDRRMLQSPYGQGGMKHGVLQSFGARSERMSLNRRTEKAGLGTGPSRHTGGSISFSEHVRRIVST